MKNHKLFLVRRLTLLGLAASALVGTSSFAATVTTYASSAAFLGAIGSAQTFDFNQPSGPISTLGSVLSIGTVGGDASGHIHSNGLCGSTGGSIDCFKPLSFTFLQPGKAFGYDNLDFNGFEEAVVTISFLNADASQSFVFDLGALPPFTPVFFGAVSDVGISKIEIYSRDPGTDLVGFRANVVDNVMVVTVPEPETYAMLFAGLGLLGFMTRRRKQNTA